MDVKTVIGGVRNELYCPHCALILKEAVQTESGTRLCEGCFNDILSYAEKKCNDCGVDLKEGSDNPENPQCQKDRAIRKEVLSLLVFCPWKDYGCSWTGKLQDYEGHHQRCEYGFVDCSNGCGVTLKRNEIDLHATECPQRQVDCQYCKEKICYLDLEQHVTRCPCALVKCGACSAEMERHKLTDHETKDCRLLQCYVCNEKVDRTKKDHVDDQEKVFNHILAMGAKQFSLEQKLEEVVLMIKEFQNRKQSDSELSSRLDAFDKKLQDLNTTVSQVPSPWTETMGIHAKMPSPRTEMLGIERGGLLSVEKKYEELERSNKLLSVRVSELELQLQASLASTHNGAFLWRIPDVAKRKRDAIEERITSIYSPPFYTGRNGYKMCIRAYLNGDGIGHTTHLSIFFVLMKGEYDPLLKWPFDHKVSLILVDQNHRKHIVQTFKPTQDSSSFQRPRTDMNVASGCPQFSKLDVLEDQSYVKDDVMYIKCIIDTSRIFHP
eukprot:Em0016g278a